MSKKALFGQNKFQPVDSAQTPEDQSLADKAKEILKHMPKKDLLKTLPPENQRAFYRHQKK